MQQIETSQIHDEIPKRIFAIINPKSGTGKGPKLWEKLLEYLKTHAPHTELNVVQSKFRGHERDIAVDALNDGTLKESDTVVIVGGDGFVFEIVSSLIGEKEIEDPSNPLLSNPICVIPGGTGNGVAKSMDITDVHDAARALLTKKPSNSNIMRVHSDVKDSSKRVDNSILSVGVGAIADHDYYAENALRFLGPLRLLLVPIGIISFCKTYPLKIRFVPHQSQSNRPLKKFTKKLSRNSDGKNWYEIDDSCFLVHAVNVPWLAHDALVAPESSKDDGAISIVICRRISRYNAAKMFLQFADGAHRDEEYVEIYKCTEFEIISKSEGLTNFAIDGQCIEAKSVSASLIKRGINIHANC